MNVGRIAFYAAFLLSAIIMICSYMRSEKPARTAFSGMASGAAALLAAHFGGSYIGLFLPLNLFTAVISVILGVPGVLIMALAERFGII